MGFRGQKRCLVGDHYPPLREKIFDVSEAQTEAMVESDGVGG